MIGFNRLCNVNFNFVGEGKSPKPDSSPYPSKVAFPLDPEPPMTGVVDITCKGSLLYGSIGSLGLSYLEDFQFYEWDPDLLTLSKQTITPEMSLLDKASHCTMIERITKICNENNLCVFHSPYMAQFDENFNLFRYFEISADVRNKNLLIRKLPNMTYKNQVAFENAKIVQMSSTEYRKFSDIFINKLNQMESDCHGIAPDATEQLRIANTLTNLKPNLQSAFF